MDLILDTHALLWMLLADTRLGLSQRRLVEDSSNIVHVSAVTAFEIATKVRLGKLPEAASISNSFETVCRDFDYRSLAVTQTHGLMAGRINSSHRDPFDRLLAAQSIVEGMPLLTSDPAFRAMGVQTVW
jgi:PIN domain nuclease of toxin-antitoxin system